MYIFGAKLKIQFGENSRQKRVKIFFEIKTKKFSLIFSRNLQFFQHYHFNINQYVKKILAHKKIGPR